VASVHRRSVAPERVDEHIHGYDPVRVHQQEREQRLLLRAAEGQLLPIPRDLEGPEERELQLFVIRSRQAGNVSRASVRFNTLVSGW
jgi:hypothetical protein